MQGDELKAIRKALGLSQEELGKRLGLSSKYVGMMERDADGAPIEPRTEMAVRFLRAIEQMERTIVLIDSKAIAFHEGAATDVTPETRAKIEEDIASLKELVAQYRS